ncbi:MAG: GNAT family N-acetyltransferase [Dehalococcoidales bacterium]
MLIRALTEKDIPAWLALAHEGDDIVSGMVPDIATFYKGFDEYMKSKIKQQEAFMVVDKTTDKCLGIVAFSKKHNRITFLGVIIKADYNKVGRELMKVALNQMDITKEITANIFKSNAEMMRKERSLLEDFGFTRTDNTILEAGAPAYQMKRPPRKMVSVG